MADTATKQRPGKMGLTDALSYRLPLTGQVSILHRISGLLLFALLPFIVWMFDRSVTSQISYEQFTAVFRSGWGVVPGWLLKLVVLVLIWSYLHHFCAGIRYLVMDVTHCVSKHQGTLSARIVLAVSLVLTVILGIKLFGYF